MKFTGVIATHGEIDRDGDMLDLSGMVTNDFTKNPMVLYSHVSSIPEPIGNVLGLEPDYDSKGNIIAYSIVALTQETNGLLA